MDTGDTKLMFDLDGVLDDEADDEVESLTARLAAAEAERDGLRVEQDLLDSKMEMLGKRLAAAEAHEQQTHERLGAILGTDTSLEEAAKRMAERLAAAEAAARWLWPKVSDDAYDAAWEKWPWLDSESAKGGRE